MNQNGTIPTWKVVQQSETTRPSGNTLIRGYLVTFQLTGGPQGTVFIPEGQYDADTVRAAIAEKVAVLSAVQNLQG